jgi:hypothetical protein
VLIKPFGRDRKQPSAFARGEIPWRPERGSALPLLRHHGNDATLQKLARLR